MTTLNQSVIKGIVKNLILPDMDYRMEIVHIINAQFLDFAIDFFKQVAVAKLGNEEINSDWYKEKFMDESCLAKKIAISSGLNMKTIKNIYGSGRKDIVISAAIEHYDSLRDLIDKLIEDGRDVDFAITIKVKKVSVELNINESLIVINALAVHRAAVRGGAWSSAGKQAEKMLMKTLCRLYSVNDENWDSLQKASDSEESFEREVDFFLVQGINRYKCEVKLMGRGNPESADAVIARRSRVFVADTLSETNTLQLDSLDVLWVALKRPNGYQRFEHVLTKLGISHKKPTGNLSVKIDQILEDIES